jgi:hypothetical protein
MRRRVIYNLEPFLPVFADATRHIVLQVCRPDSCIYSVACAVDILRRFGVEGHPFPCKVMIANKKFADMEKQLGGWPTEPGELEQDWLPCGAYSVGIGFGARQPGKWDGHLLLHVVTSHLPYVVDLSIDQASRPDKDIDLDGLVTGGVVPQSFIQGEPLRVGFSNGCFAVYYPQPDNLTYLQSPDWTDPVRREVVVEAVVEHLKERGWRR